jgi:hypothetical protein
MPSDSSLLIVALLCSNELEDEKLPYVTDLLMCALSKSLKNDLFEIVTNLTVQMDCDLSPKRE